LAAGKMHAFRHQGALPDVRGSHRPLPPGAGGLRVPRCQSGSRWWLDQSFGVQSTTQPPMRHHLRPRPCTRPRSASSRWWACGILTM
jgi:hypothetical protein